VDDQGREEVKALLAGEEQAGLPKARLMAVRLAFTGQQKLGDLLKDRIGNILYDALSDIEAASCEKLRPIWNGPARASAA
jgi:hypothetical protein